MPARTARTTAPTYSMPGAYPRAVASVRKPSTPLASGPDDETPPRPRPVAGRGGRGRLGAPALLLGRPGSGSGGDAAHSGGRAAGVPVAGEACDDLGGVPPADAARRAARVARPGAGGRPPPGAGPAGRDRCGGGGTRPVGDGPEPDRRRVRSAFGARRLPGA